jgi:hypothetical protein
MWDKNYIMLNFTNIVTFCVSSNIWGMIDVTMCLARDGPFGLLFCGTEEV